MSQNMIVTCRRSATFASFGGVLSGTGLTAGLVARLTPHSAQNFALTEFKCPHARHSCGSVEPHSSQNLLPAGTTVLQLGHSIVHPPTPTGPSPLNTQETASPRSKAEA